MGSPAGPSHSSVDPRMSGPRHSGRRQLVRHHGSIPRAASLHARSAGPAAACQTMQLVLARASNDHDQPAIHVFDDRQIKVLDALQARLQGRTTKQQNPYPPRTLAWAAWTIARLGGWSGYESERSTGPITMRNGLERFNAIVQGYFLDEDVCSC